MNAAGDDCDGWAGMNAKAIDYALSRYQWKGYIVSVLADPVEWSHHIAVGHAPDGKWWAMQPQPNEDTWKALGAKQYLGTIYGPYDTVEKARDSIMAQYPCKVEWSDLRDSQWNQKRILY